MEKEFDIDSLVSDMDFKSLSLVDCGNGILLTNREIEVLKRYGVDYKKSQSLKEIIYYVEDILNEDSGEDLDDLEYISASIAERDYYQNTNK